MAAVVAEQWQQPKFDDAPVDAPARSALKSGFVNDVNAEGIVKNGADLVRERPRHSLLACSSGNAVPGRRPCWIRHSLAL
jgi:hypothetical protein